MTVSFAGERGNNLPERRVLVIIIIILTADDLKSIHELKDAKFDVYFHIITELIGFDKTVIILKPSDFGLLMT
jgi:hypothetical protein